jgi:DHA2 family multidrug resistance protein
MIHFNLDMGTTPVVVSGFFQGMGIGFTFVPLSAVTFATLAPQLRNAGTPIYSLMRNLGGSVGISIVQALQSQGATRSHSQIVESVNASNPALSSLPPYLQLDQLGGLALLNGEVTRQANMISFIHVFHIMMWLCLVSLPFMFLVRTQRNNSTTNSTSSDANNAPTDSEPAH